MKELTGYFLKKNILFKNIKQIDIKKLNSRKKMEIYTATSTKREFYCIFISNAKSRFLRRNAEELYLLHDSLVYFTGNNFKKKILLISSPLCSKAKEYLEENNWRVEIDFM